MVEGNEWRTTGTHADGSDKPVGTWARRAAAYFLGVILPWALVSQAMSMVATGSFSPAGGGAWLIYCAAFVIVVAVSAALTTNGQSPAQRFLKIQVCDLSGSPVSSGRAGLRNLAHVVDVATLGIGFLWPLCDLNGQTFADRIMGTRVRRVPSRQDFETLRTTTAPRPPVLLAKRLPQ